MPFMCILLAFELNVDGFMLILIDWLFIKLCIFSIYLHDEYFPMVISVSEPLWSEVNVLKVGVEWTVLIRNFCFFPLPFLMSLSEPYIYTSAPHIWSPGAHDINISILYRTTVVSNFVLVVCICTILNTNFRMPLNHIFETSCEMK